MKFTLIRHSKTKVEPQKPIVLWGLDDSGIEKAQSLGQQACIKDLDVIYASLQTKAIETLLYLAKPNTIPMRTNNDVAEFDWEPKTFTRLWGQ